MISVCNFELKWYLIAETGGLFGLAVRLMQLFSENKRQVDLWFMYDRYGGGGFFCLVLEFLVAFSSESNQNILRDSQIMQMHEGF